jgi:hypothetical protein
LRLGFLDGHAGWTICRIAALETFWKYRELRSFYRREAESSFTAETRRRGDLE